MQSFLIDTLTHPEIGIKIQIVHDDDELMGLCFAGSVTRNNHLHNLMLKTR